MTTEHCLIQEVDPVSCKWEWWVCPTAGRGAASAYLLAVSLDHDWCEADGVPRPEVPPKPAGLVKIGRQLSGLRFGEFRVEEPGV